MFGRLKKSPYLCTRNSEMVPVVQLVRASDCGSECRGFESHRAPSRDIAERQCLFFVQQKRHRFCDVSFYSVGFRYQRTVQLSFSPGAKAVYAPWFSISI